ncbi:MAG: hypothetical protein ACYTGP_07615 [Planctomycetota bacterium]|jgi:hypothetical protein
MTSAMIPALLATATLGAVEVIYTEVPGHPTAVVPGARDGSGAPVVTEFKSIEILALSPDGSRWLLKARSHAGPGLETMMLVGSGVTGSVFAQQGQPVAGGAAGERYDFFGSNLAPFNSHDEFVLSARTRFGPDGPRHMAFVSDGAAFTTVRVEGDLITGLLDVPGETSGDEQFGNFFGTLHLLDDGTVGSRDLTIRNIHPSRRPALLYDDAVFRQADVSAAGAGTWDHMDAFDFHTTPDGAHYFVQGDDLGPEESDDILVVDGEIVLREGEPVAGSALTVASVFNTNLLSDGTWFTRGRSPDDVDWAVRDGAFFATTGDPVPHQEFWDFFYAFTGNRVGDWAIAGQTTGEVDANDVIVVNGRVVAREGDPVDLDGNGVFDDDAYLGRGFAELATFPADNLWLTDDGTVWFLARLRDARGFDLGLDGSVGDAFLRVPGCPADLNDDGTVSFADVLALIAAWGACETPCAEDLNGDAQVDFADVLLVIAAWGEC